MRAGWTVSGACTSGSTAHPGDATRRASGGAATTSTTTSEAWGSLRGFHSRRHSTDSWLPGPPLDRGKQVSIEHSSDQLDGKKATNWLSPLFVAFFPEP